MEMIKQTNAIMENWKYQCNFEEWFSALFHGELEAGSAQLTLATLP